MMQVIEGLLLSFSQYPKLVLLVFLASVIVVFNFFSEGKPKESALGVLRILGSYFTTPFMFLRKTLRMFRDSENREAPYAGTFEHVLHRVNRFAYLGIFLLSLGIFAAGVGSALVALYPAAELQERAILGEQLEELEKQLEEQKSVVASSAAPDFRQRMNERARLAKAEFDRANAAYTAYSGNTGFNSPLLESIRNSNTIESLDAVKTSFDEFFADCPEGASWTDFTPELCTKFRSAAVSLEEKRRQLIRTYLAYQEAQSAADDGASAARTAKQRVDDLQQQVDSVTKLHDEASLFRRSWVKQHIQAFVLALGTALIAVIVVVWSGAIFADIGGWLILMMLRLEKSTPRTLRPGFDEADASDSDNPVVPPEGLDDSANPSSNSMATPESPPEPSNVVDASGGSLWHVQTQGHPDGRTADAATLLRLRDANLITDDTLVWTEGLTEWVRFIEVAHRIKAESRS